MMLIISKEEKKFVSSEKVQSLIEEYHKKFDENPPNFNHWQYKNGEDMFNKLTEAIQTGKPIIPKHEPSMFDI